MTRSSTKELLTPFENPERVLHSRRKLFKTPSLTIPNSPEFDQISKIEEEEVIEIMAETMEQYMSKTRGEYGSGVARPKIDANAQFEHKGQFLKELRDNNFSGPEHKDANEHIKKVLDIVDLFQIPNVTQDQIMLRAFPVSLTGATSHWLRNEPASLITTWEFGAPFQPGGQYRAAGPGFYQRNNGNSSYPAQRDTMEESLSKFMAESAKRRKENSNIIKEIRASTDSAIQNQGASIKTLELQIGQMSKVLQERGFGSLPSSIETILRDQVKLISTATTDLSEI
ncbi:hypothetical protein Tco_1274742 [Tanacetum coccineum]